MILSYQTIKKLAAEQGMINPYYERTIFNGMSYGAGPASYDFRIAQDLIINPGGFKLASTMEKVKIPNNVCASVADKSSWARKGIAVQNTYFDPGFEGYPTIELSNHSWNIIHIPIGSPICQFIFMKLDKVTEKPYRGKYQNQPNRPIEALQEK